MFYTFYLQGVTRVTAVVEWLERLFWYGFDLSGGIFLESSMQIGPTN